MNKLFFFNTLRKTTTISFSSPCHHGLLWFSTAAAAAATKTQTQQFIVDYLVNSCGLSPEKAARACIRLPKTKFPSDPDSVLLFLRRAGFSDADITRFLSKDPRFLYTDVDKTLRPKLAVLSELGLSDPDIIDLISNSPTSLWFSDLRLRIGFWKSLFGATDHLLKACRRDNFLLSSSLAERALPNVSLLRDRGVSDAQIAHMVIKIPRLVTRSPESFAAAVEWVEELGFSVSSGMFFHALHLVACNTREGFDAKLRFLKSLGWSEPDLMSAVKKHPKMFNLTEENLRSKMEFFVEEVGFEISALARSPVLLDLSLERRLRPRYSILRALKGDGSTPVATNFLVSENDFLERYVPKEEVPELYEAYVAACAASTSLKLPVLSRELMDRTVVGVEREEEEELVFDGRRSAREDVLFSKNEHEDNKASTAILRSLYLNATISIISEKLLMVKICCSILFSSKLSRIDILVDKVFEKIGTPGDLNIRGKSL